MNDLFSYNYIHDGLVCGLRAFHCKTGGLTAQTDKLDCGKLPTLDRNSTYFNVRRYCVLLIDTPQVRLLSNPLSLP